LSSNALNTDGTSANATTVDPGEGFGGAIGSETAVYCLPFDSLCLYSHRTLVHVYDMAAQNATDGGYKVVQPADTASMATCAPRCFIPVGFDWRLSAAVNARTLLTEIESVLAATHSDRVDILAHSQGGLVVNALVHQPASVGKIYRVVTLGTPFLGAPKATAELVWSEP
jgi:pimeloyl-ACP methyl ester carboxylesterase